MRIFDARLTQLRYTEEFGRVEALVALLIKQRAGQPPREIRVRTSQPLRGTAPLDIRLIDDATRLARRLYDITDPKMLRAA